MAFNYPYLIILTLVTISNTGVSGQKIAQTYHVRENLENSTFVGNVARDTLLYENVSETEFQRLKFTFFTQGNPHAKLFRIDEKSSTIRTNAVLDRETICKLQVSCVVTLDIAVYMRDRVINDYDLYKLMKVNVVIDDLNDNSPKFPEYRVSLSVPESVFVGHVLLTSGAVDEDMGENHSIQKYDLIPSDGMFSLRDVKNWDGSADLGIVVMHPLDRETRDQFQIKVIAKDGGFPPKSGSVLIDITVTDVNDNPPVFTQKSYNISVFENLPLDKTVLQLATVDADEGANGEVYYRFHSLVSDSGRQAFNIERNTGRIFAVGNIDYEKTKQYQFMVEAYDGGSPSLFTGALVTVNVKDENDNYPQININLTPEGTEISEAVDTNKFVAHVSVNDKDSGRNGFVVCTMSDSHFTLENFFENSYKIILSKKLDHETQGSHNVTVTCQDNGQVPLSNSSSFTVQVLDENDNFPEFSRTFYTGSIIENNEIGEEVLQVSAHDWDSEDNGRVQYLLDDENAERYFSIDRFSGMISANDMLDRELHPEFKFNVMAKDFGDDPKAQSVSVIVEVLDQNDQPPRFKRPWFFLYVLENQSPGAVAGNITAVDEDTLANSEFLYSIPINSWALDYFTVHPRTGLVTTKKKFDREHNDQFSFTVNVRDPQVPGFFDSANLTIYILDDNDNVPIIEFPTADNFTADVPFDTSVGTVLATIQAFDKDEPANAKIIYSLKSGNNRHLFNLNRVTGDLTMSRRIRPDDSGLYKLQIMVSDSGNPPMASRTKFYLNVAESNGTAFGFGNEGEIDKNVLIVISLVAVTLILGIAIVTTICLIKRIDRERRQQVILMKNEEEKMFSVLKKDSFSSNDSNDHPEEDFKKNNLRKEVSFSLEDGHDLNTTASSGTAFSTFKSQPNSHSNQGGIQDSCLVIGNNTFSSLNNQSANNIPVSDELPPPPLNEWNKEKEKEAHELMEILKRGEDAGSQSSGEAGTSDSGRGGSDEENHKEGATETDDPRYYHANSFYPTNFNRYHDGRQSSLSLSAAHGSLGHLTPFHPHGNIHTGSIGSGYRRWKDIGQTPVHAPDHGPGEVFNDSYLRMQILSGEHVPKYGRPLDPRHPMHLNHHPKPMDFIHPRPLQFVHDESFQTVDSSAYDDDDRTTMSGSYTINHEDLRPERDEQYFNDVVV